MPFGKARKDEGVWLGEMVLFNAGKSVRAVMVCACSSGFGRLLSYRKRNR
jgi:hypothetical protein